MTEKTKKYLSDILKAIDFAEDFTKDIETFEQYAVDYKTQSAVERQLAIIGEAVNNIRKEEDSVSLSFANQIVGFRNRIIHAYDGVDNKVMWTILKNNLPILKNEVQILLAL